MMHTHGSPPHSKKYWPIEERLGRSLLGLVACGAMGQATSRRGREEPHHRGFVETCGHWFPVGGEGKQGRSGNVLRSPADCEAASRRAAALLLFTLWSLEGEPEFRRSSERRKQLHQEEQRFFAVVFARHRRSSGRFSAAVGGLCGGFPPGGEVTREVTEVSWLSHACGCERRAHCEFNRHCQSAYAFLNLKARAPVRGWVLFGGHLGGRSETTSDSDRERFLSYVMTQKKL